ncbi:acetyl-CoA carboxylase biotin carboxylase subunit [Tenuibacillus multivorans]|uniref:biotin carboxylase n=1 Tax=Tenuibacillus multivorans TaxID=237069 RepID=A0A1H0CJF1_9BACI|nr:acetyl-CoA carboxylase biotin carboxylase subunit [Tenuibacillus multivorans]GEL76271.1 biotin carboxylase 2 [Tenuibacillus multivorans]SDN58009.1 acetyl-CoA carboxylase, biotin carboxylase subunit [Tenuibacillus multivorans]
MFKSVLIANRGEIARRVIKTCKRLNIRTIAVYSEADEPSLHVKEADESYLIGPARVNESYLNIDKIIEVAKESQAEAIHPGYGLLSENIDFAKRCQEEGITFIGPDSDAIDQMGSKLMARKTMENAGVPIIPGTNDPIPTAEEAKVFANQIGYPIMLKASHGGGGIGMQIVNNDEEVVKAFESNAHRAKQFFGDGTMFIEKVIENAHHVEIQLLADQHGNVLHLFDRECSIQRRHQKVIEEAPSPLLTEETRQQMADAAVKAAKAIHYKNAGTIEFLVDENQNFYFLEMNTRLQVEHPVTEEITGIDLVEQQLKVAYGEELSLKQNDLSIQGHAIEARIYAEDPKTFFPSPGTITELQLPEDVFIRHDIAIESNYQITPYYDPMIAKLIVKGDTREEAVVNLKNALNDYKVEGIKTNLPLLRDIVDIQAFKDGHTRTSFINEFILINQ